MLRNKEFVIHSSAFFAEPCAVEMSVVICFDPEANLSGGSENVLRIDASKSNVLELCKPVKVHIWPKPAKR